MVVLVVKVVVDIAVAPTVVTVVLVIVEPIVILSVVPDVKVTAVARVSEEDVLAVVLVPPTQETLILFFKSLIKRIKIDINMTKLQVLGELL